MMGRLDRKSDVPPHAVSKQSWRTDALASSRYAMHPLLAQSGGSQDGPLSREAPRLGYNLPITPGVRQSPPVLLQQTSSPVIQRKSEVGAVLEGMLALLILYASDDLESEILKGILASRRPLNLQGTDKEQEAQLRAHVDARKGVVDFAGKNRFQYATKDYKYNPDFWDDDSDAPERAVKSGVDPKAALADLHVHPEEYALGCKQAAVLTMRAGSNSSLIVKDENVSDRDWIPGDWGYIKNPKVKPDHAGQEGQNLIYLGGGQFWGAIDGKTTRTMKEWLAQVYSWDGVAELQTWRKRPILGVAKTKP